MKENRSMPRRRFEGFNKEWEIKLLLEVANIVGGGTPSTSVKEYWEGEIDWYSPVEIGEKIYVNESQKKITKYGFENSSTNILPIGTILFTSRAGIGKTAILQKEATTNQGFQSIVPITNKLNSYFIFSRSEELKRYGEKNGAGSTFLEISGKQLEKMPIKLPEINEQQKIGNFFKHLDQIITLEQRKLEKTIALKSAYLAEMFPAEGERVPKRRFGKFEDKWILRELGEVANFFNNMRIPIDTQKRIKGNYPYYGATGVIDYVKDYIFEGEYILLAEDGENILSRNNAIAYLTKGKFWVNNHAHVMDMRAGSNLFLLQLLEKTDYKKYNSGTAQPKLNGERVKSMTFYFPSVQEQQAIGEFFKKLDDSITIQQQKLDKLKAMKQAYLQEMFV